MKVILFDLDGTLTDSAPGITACVQYALEKMGKPEKDLDKLRSFVGPPLKGQFMSYAGFSQEEAQEAVRYYRERYSESGMYENSLYPGVRELLAYLKDRGCVLAVASSKPEVYVRQILDHFHITEFFREIVGAGMDEKRTTKAEVIEEALKRLDMTSSRQDVVMVGDRSYDILGAHECGIQCVGVAYGYGSLEELIRAGVTYVADSVEELEILAENGVEEPQVEISSIDITELNREEDKQQKQEKRKKKRKKGEGEEEYPIREAFFLKLWRTVYPVLAYAGITNLVTVVATMAIMFIGMIVLGIRSQQDLTNLAMQQVLALTGLSNLVAVPVLALFIRRDKNRRNSGKYDIRKSPEKKVTPQNILGAMLMGMGLSQVLNDLIVLSGLNELFPYYSQVGEQIYEGQNVILTVVVAAVIAPAAEEMIFRGLMQMRIRDYLGPVAAILISAVCFGIYHGNMVQFVYAGIFGIFLGYAMERSQSLLVPIAAHMTANFWTVIGMSVLQAVFGTSDTAGGIVDIVMAVVFFSGLSLVGVTGRKKVKHAGEEKISEDTVKAENTEKKEAEKTPVVTERAAEKAVGVCAAAGVQEADKTEKSGETQVTAERVKGEDAGTEDTVSEVIDVTENK